jgi:signal transduction histidine kinase
LKNIGIRTKIISITLLFLGVGLFIAPEVLVNIAELRFKEILEEGSEKLVEELKEDYQNLEPLESQRFIPYFVLVYDKQNGKLISEYSFSPPSLIDDYDPQSNKFGENLTDLNFIKTESNDKKVDIVVGFSESTPSEIINGIERIFIVIYILASLLVVVGILISIQIALKPVDKSIKKIEKLDPLNKLEKLDEVASNDEIGNLISTFNSLLEKVNISSISQKQFISNASHELKTPLTSLKLQIEKLSVLNGVNVEMIKNIQEDIDEIQSTLEALLDLETSGSNTEGSEEVLVNELIKAIVVGTDIVFQDKKEIKVFSNSKVVKLMLNNLIGNAEKFKSKTTVISADLVHGIPSVIVEDDGGGIKPENYDLIFTPFWQEDESRTRNKSGKGIGLSIVKNIALKYGWTISVDKSELGGAKFIISF